MEAKSKELCKIRKRGNSSSSSSSVVKNYRFKRAILVGKRGGSSTPVPSWKTSSKSPSVTMPMVDSTKISPTNKAKESAVSARKLAATLWEINTVPSDFHEDSKILRNKEKAAKFPHLSDPFSEKMNRPRGNGHHSRKSSLRKKIQLTDYHFVETVNTASLIENESQTKGKSSKESRNGIKSHLKDISNGLTASKEVLKVLSRIWGIYEKKSSPGMSLVAALAMELDQASIQVNQLIKEHRSNRNEMDRLIKHFEEEKTAWKGKQRATVQNAIACVAEELEVEKKLRRQTERLNKKLGKELADTKKSLSQALKELESEKRAKEILEQVCDELARGIGEDRSQVEELKKVREEVEKEREMLQLADVLREERVQMKLSEAKYHFEEKNAAVERLTSELEAYLREKVIGGKETGDMSPNYKRIKELETYLKQIQDTSCQRTERELTKNEGGGDDSDDSDLHSIELNMDNNSKSYKWSYACDGDVLEDTKRVSVDRDFKGRKSISENIQWGSICLITKNDKNSDVFDREKSPEDDRNMRSNDHEDEIMQFKSNNSLREHNLFSTKPQPMRDFVSPTKEWGQTSLAIEDAGSEVSDSSPVLNGDNLKAMVMGSRGRNLASSRH